MEYSYFQAGGETLANIEKVRKQSEAGSFPLRLSMDVSALDAAFVGVKGALDLIMRREVTGTLATAFVRTGNDETAKGFTQGHIRDNVTVPLAGLTKYHSDAESVTDAVKLGQQWYLRVVNDSHGEPFFLPPDSIPVSVEAMLELDRQEHLRLQARPEAQDLRNQEFTYFRLEGELADKVKKFERDTDDRNKALEALRDAFGARSMYMLFGNRNEKGIMSLSISDFQFRSPVEVPAGWSVISQDEDDVRARPVEGSADWQKVRQVEKALAERGILEVPRLRDLIAPKSFPDRARPHGDYSDAFVRSNSRKAEPTFREGKLRDNTTRPDPEGWWMRESGLDVMNMGGAYYLRVPRDEITGMLPVMPEDAFPMSLSEMMEVDRREDQRRQLLDQMKDMLGEAASETRVQAISLGASSAKVSAKFRARGLA